MDFQAAEGLLTNREFAAAALKDSALHALCILKSREGHPPAEIDDVQETEEENLGLEFT